MTDQEITAMRRSTRTEQGLHPDLTDPAQLERIAAIVDTAQRAAQNHGSVQPRSAAS